MERYAVQINEFGAPLACAGVSRPGDPAPNPSYRSQVNRIGRSAGGPAHGSGAAHPCGYRCPPPHPGLSPTIARSAIRRMLRRANWSGAPCGGANCASPRIPVQLGWATPRFSTEHAGREGEHCGLGERVVTALKGTSTRAWVSGEWLSIGRR